MSSTTAAEGTPSATLEGTGTLAHLVLSPAGHDFGDVRQGDPSGPFTFTVSNDGTATSRPLTVGRSGADAADFTAGADSCTGATLAPGGSCTVEIGFTPSRVAAESASLDVSTSVAAEGAPGSTLAGAGTLAHLVLTPAGHDFGDVRKGNASTPFSFVVSNDGTATSRALAVAVAGADAADFATANDTCTGQTLVAGGSCTVEVTFTPSRLTAEGASLNVTSTVAAEGAPSATLAGTGTPPPFRGIVSAGSVHTCFMRPAGTVVCWGSNGGAQLGDGTATNRTTPVAVVSLFGATSISAGQSHSCAVDAGTAKCWGFNASGQIGDNTTTPRFGPRTAVPPITDAVAVVAGLGHSCALRSTKEVKCWGHPGTLGNGSTAGSLVPVDVSGINTAIAISADNSHTCVLLEDGRIACWGVGGTGQLGDGATTNRLAPVIVAGISTAIAVSAGGNHTCALLADGSVKCWGNNGSGQLGDGTLTGSASPVTVTGIANATAISAGFSHTCALLGDGSIRCWGDNGEGQLGDGTRIRRVTPVAVTGLHAPALTVSAGSAAHTCAVLETGGVDCWGLNNDGQLGDGTFGTNRLTPVAVVGLP